MPSGTIVKGGYVDYQIVKVKLNGDCYIEYNAVRYTGEQYGGNATQKATYTIYEYFVKGIHQRLKDSKVEQIYPNPEARKAFLKLAEQKTGLKLGTNNHVADNSHNHEDDDVSLPHRPTCLLPFDKHGHLGSDPPAESSHSGKPHEAKVP